MTAVSETICANCGNQMQDGRCPRCDANAFSMARRWRKGDRKGKRPERRYDRRRLQDTIDGTWKNERHKITVHIDTDGGSYRTVHGKHQDTTHRFSFHEEAYRSLSFYKDDLLIKAYVSDMGFLIMESGDKKMAFAYESDEMLFRTCPLCYGKTPIEHDGCGHCYWEFEAYE